MLDLIEKNNKKVLSAGYPAVESLIDSEDFTEINAAFEKAYSDLAAAARTKRGLKKSREAKKAMKAIEHVVDLFKELLEVKFRLQEMLNNAGTGKKRSR